MLGKSISILPNTLPRRIAHLQARFDSFGPGGAVYKSPAVRVPVKSPRGRFDCRDVNFT